MLTRGCCRYREKCLNQLYWVHPSGLAAHGHLKKKERKVCCLLELCVCVVPSALAHGQKRPLNMRMMMVICGSASCAHPSGLAAQGHLRDEREKGGLLSASNMRCSLCVGARPRVNPTKVWIRGRGWLCLR